jgi:uncharacterized protein YggE
MGEGLGLRVGPVRSVSEGYLEEPSVMGNVMVREEKRGLQAMPVEAGDVEVTATVTVIFAVIAR